jgi:hypothetical protein
MYCLFVYYSGSVMFESPDMDTNGYDSDDDCKVTAAATADDDDGYNAFEQQKKRKKMFHQQNQRSMAMLSDDSSSNDDDDDDDDVTNTADKYTTGERSTPKFKANAPGGNTRVKKTNVWSGDPGTKAGHVATHVSSYFSRLWKNGNKSRVWYLYLRKLN